MVENWQEEEPQARPVLFRFSEAVGALIPGTRNHIISAWVEQNGTKVSKVVVGQVFDVVVQFEAENVGAHTWHCTITCIDPTGAIACFFDQSIGTANPLAVNDYINKAWVLQKTLTNTDVPKMMPAGTGALVLTLRLWLNDDWNVSPTTPPQSLWLNGVSGQSPAPNQSGPFTA